MEININGGDSFHSQECIAFLGIVPGSEPGNWIETVLDFKHPAAESIHQEGMWSITFKHAMSTYISFQGWRREDNQGFSLRCESLESGL